jgi:hypothetical protein
MKQVSFAGAVEATQDMPEEIPRLVTLKPWTPFPREEKRSAQDIVER